VPRLVLNADLRRAQGERRLLYLEKNGCGGPFVELDDQVAAMLERFRVPVEPDDVVAPEDGDGSSVIRALLDLGFLVDEAHLPAEPAFALTPAAPAAFALQSYDLAEGVAGEVVVVGACSDDGTLPGHRRGTERGPDVVREAATTIAGGVRLDTGEQVGWFDYESETWLLRGARLFDAGNVLHPAGASARQYRNGLANQLRWLRARGARVLVIGGDHSLSLAAIDALDVPEIGIVHFDAHSDCGSPRFEDDVHHGNFVRWLLERDAVKSVVHVGVRGVQPRDARPSSPKYRCVTTHRARSGTADDVRRLCTPDLPYYISVDIDVLDPSIAPDTPVPVPEGLGLAELRGMIRAIGDDVEVLGADVMEVMPGDRHGSTTGRAAAEICLELLHALSRPGCHGE
jgi:agmatinase